MMLHYTEWKEIMCDPALMEPCITLMFTTKTLEILLYLKCLDVCSSLSGVGVAPWVLRHRLSLLAQSLYMVVWAVGILCSTLTHAWISTTKLLK